MSAILKVNPRVSRLINYIKDIEEGKLQIPSFQRDFVWGKKEKLELFESLKLGYPIGSLLFWKPKDRFKVKEDIGPYKMPLSSLGENDFYILDGFQRLSTLFGCLINPATTNLERNDTDPLKEYMIFYDLDNQEFTFNRGGQVDVTLIPVNKLIDTFAFLGYVDDLRSSIMDSERSTMLIDRARALSSVILDYQLPSIEILGGTIEDAVDIFSRINSKGSKISVDWMVSALTYNEDLDFRLGTEIDQLIVRLETFNFEKIKRELIVQCIQTSFGKIYFDEKISDLVKRANFIEATKLTFIAIEQSVKFLFEELLVIDIKLLPYNSQLVFISYFFKENPSPSDAQLKSLKNWFWITTYSNYFTIYSLSKQRLAFIKFKDFCKGIESDPVYIDKPRIPFSVPEFPRAINFGSVRSKALVLFLLNFSNDFISIESDKVDEFKILYLFKDSQVPEGSVPIINYISSEASKNLIQTKHQDLSFILSEDTFKNYYRELFLDKKMESLHSQNKREHILKLRKIQIQKEEEQFVNSLGLVYREVVT